MGQNSWHQDIILFTSFIMQIILANERFQTSLNNTCITKNVNGMKVASCGKNQEFEQAARTPFCYHTPHNDLPDDVQVFDLTPGQYMDFSANCLTRSDFIRYKKLIKIIIRKNWIVHRNRLHREGPHNESLYADVFSNLDSLEHLEFSESKLNNLCVITLPKNLKTLIIRNNDYEFLDIHWSSKLEEIDASDNKLQSMPLFHDPLPPLKILRLKGNPLSSMTVLNIASFCTLTSLELEFPLNYTYSNPDAQYCKCETFKSWAQLANISNVEKLECYKPKVYVNCPYSRDIMEGAQILRQMCLEDLRRSMVTTSTSRPNSTIQSPKSSGSKMMYIFLGFLGFFFLLFLLLAAVLAYRFRQYAGSVFSDSSTSSKKEGSVSDADDDEEEDDSDEEGSVVLS